jgi:uncharacterized protein involved in exopolysaccharide biosynthesis
MGHGLSYLPIPAPRSPNLDSGSVVRYVETFFRHLLLLTLPIAIALIGAFGVVVAQPRVYSSSVKIWVDRSSYGLTASDNSYLTPAQEQSDVISELLRTRSFSLAVGKQGEIADELRSRAASNASQPIAKLQSFLGLGSNALSPSSSSDAVDDAVYAAVTKYATVQPTGPQIITVTYTDNDPQVAAATAQAVFDQFVVQLLSTKRDQTKAAVDFYTTQVKGAESDVNAADANLFDYLGRHPELANNTISSADPTLAALRQTDDLVRKRYDDLTAKLDGARLDDAGLAQAGPNGFHILDKARVPAGPDSHTLLLVEAAAGGLLAGLAISACGLLALTFADTSLSRPDEVERLLGLRVVGAVGVIDRLDPAA